ncbi:MAG: DUF4389 domain-containing protein [Pirellulales bacterium]|nr:DUF4389 domain-containing protein [Pirellulales bacterium]
MTPQDNAQRNRKEECIFALFVLLFFIAMKVVVSLVMLVALFQVVHTLVVFKPNGHVRHFGEALGRYLGQIGRFVAHGTETKPWPFSAWPDVAASSSL